MSISSKNNNITSHTVVRNEDRFIYFTIKSVIDHVDQMFIYDTGSTDKTVDIIKSFNSPKIIFKKFGPQSPPQITKLRQQQLKLTKTKWFLILDGDEVWWHDSIKALVKLANSNPKGIWGVITPTINCIGDIYHYQEAAAGKYQYGDIKGHYAVRLIQKLPGLYLKDSYPLEGYFTKQNKLITDYHSHLKLLNRPYLHLTNLSRSTASESNVISRDKKYELGIPFDKHFKYPQVFYQPYPQIVPNPWVKATNSEKLFSALITPLKKIKRRLT